MSLVGPEGEVGRDSGWGGQAVLLDTDLESEQ